MHASITDLAIGSFIVCGCVCLLVISAKEIEKPEPIIRRVEVCSPRSIDNYPPVELRRIAAARERMERVRK